MVFETILEALASEQAIPGALGKLAFAERPLVNDMKRCEKMCNNLVLLNL